MTLLTLILPPIALFCCSKNVWNGIVPLKTGKADVEKQLGKPMRNPDPDYDIGDYKYKGGIVTIVFAIGGCRGGAGDYSVERGTVVRISDRPEPMPLFT